MKTCGARRDREEVTEKNHSGGLRVCGRPGLRNMDKYTECVTFKGGQCESLGEQRTQLRQPQTRLKSNLKKYPE